LNAGDRVRCKRYVELGSGNEIFQAGDIVWIKEIVCNTFVRVSGTGDKLGYIGLGLVEDFEPAPISDRPAITLEQAYGRYFGRLPEESRRELAELDSTNLMDLAMHLQPELDCKIV